MSLGTTCSIACNRLKYSLRLEIYAQTMVRFRVLGPHCGRHECPFFVGAFFW